MKGKYFDSERERERLEMGGGGGGGGYSQCFNGLSLMF